MKKARIADEKLRGRLKDVGLRIAFYRKRRNLTQDELAERADYSVSYLGRVESCRENDMAVPALDFLYRVADELGISVIKLLEEEDK